MNSYHKLKVQGQTEFDQMPLEKAILKPRHSAEVECSQLIGGLADLVGRIGKGPGKPVNDREPKPGQFQLDLTGKGQPRQSSHANQNVVGGISRGGMVYAHNTSCPRTQRPVTYRAVMPFDAVATFGFARASSHSHRSLGQHAVTPNRWRSPRIQTRAS